MVASPTVRVFVTGASGFIGGAVARRLAVEHAVDLLACDCTLRIDEARRELGYAPRIGIEEGLRALGGAPPPPPSAPATTRS